MILQFYGDLCFSKQLLGSSPLGEEAPFSPKVMRLFVEFLRESWA